MPKREGDATSSIQLVSLEHFKDFVRRIVSVPKGEINRRLAEKRKKRHRKPPRR